MKTHIQLVNNRNELFPLSKEDFEALLSLKVSNFRISVSLLETLKLSLLKRASVEIIPFDEAFSNILDKFKEAVKPAKIKVQGNVILLLFSTDDTVRINDLCSSLTTFMGRYGMKVTRETKVHNEEEKLFISRILIEPDSDINPSVFFGDSIEESVENCRLHLSSVAALVFISRPSKIYPGKRTFGIEFQDKIGDNWETAFSRHFDLKSVSTKEVTQVINLFISLVNSHENFVPPVTPKTTRR